MRVVFHPIADDEYWHEVEYYHAVKPELGSKFTNSVDDVVRAIAVNPYLCHNRGDGIYSVRLKGFPISIFYKCNAECIFVLSVCHEMRNPKIWKSRK